MKDLTSSNAQSCACIFFCLFFFYSFYDYYLFTCFSMAINYFCDLNSALSLSVQNTRIRKTLFFSEQDMLHPAITESIRMNSHRELYCTNAISLQVINSIYPLFNMIHIFFWSSSHYCYSSLNFLYSALTVTTQTESCFLVNKFPPILLVIF